ncbi:hypothetical protein CEUSTIGMA_g10585.t1 [Chlamydomonas eustigma]|uniref:thioredoxin-dependent peroxiredoxin n=1 Tax=Chlamydomonas eustigma TaxID=1157962 RepID=A0A250XJQ9_9CHLO|nr:hypothetical protein CEUSTIGMA_g10585.t1 [Chlamydomonas eustigma]|eukprot:GAX83159.1 hypothetical protein CEUSTIGMA_g10585.t1 [Chlamydomonas eustigma]
MISSGMSSKLAGSGQDGRTFSRSIATPSVTLAKPEMNKNPLSISRRLSLVISAALKVGDRMDDYSDYFRILRTNEGNSLSLSSFKGKSPVVLFFYPKAATPGCTKEACKFRDEFDRFKSAGAEVFGISSDSPEENDKFAKAQRLQYPLLTDPSSILRKTFGIPNDFLGLLPGRQTYVIDKNGKVVLCFNDALNVEGHVDAALKALMS